MVSPLPTHPPIFVWSVCILVKSILRVFWTSTPSFFPELFGGGVYNRFVVITKVLLSSLTLHSGTVGSSSSRVSVPREGTSPRPRLRCEFRSGRCRERVVIEEVSMLVWDGTIIGGCTVWKPWVLPFVTGQVGQYCSFRLTQDPYVVRRQRRRRRRVVRFRTYGSLVCVWAEGLRSPGLRLD